MEYGEISQVKQTAKLALVVADDEKARLGGPCPTVSLADNGDNKHTCGFLLK